jgi:hypothetical protein
LAYSAHFLTPSWRPETPLVPRTIVVIVGSPSNSGWRGGINEALLGARCGPFKVSRGHVEKAESWWGRLGQRISTKHVREA